VAPVTAATEAVLMAEAGRFARETAAGLDPCRAGVNGAATAHLAESRPLDLVLAEYSALLDAAHAGQPHDPAELATLGQELGMLRMAEATVHGRAPGTPHAVTAG